MKFHISTPDHELSIGYFTLIIKYIVLFIVTWIASWIFLLFTSSKPTLNDYGIEKVDRLLDNSDFVSLIISILTVCFYSINLYNKSKLGLIKEIEFCKESGVVKFEILNLINGKSKKIEINESNLRIEKSTKSNFIIGNQRIFTFYERDSIFTRLNLDLTAWVRHIDLPKLLLELEKYIKKTN